MARRRQVEAGPVAVIGAGPHGLATAAHLRHAGIQTLVFGGVLDFWRRNMPRGMLLRSRKRSSSIADPERRFTLDAWSAATGRRLVEPIPIEDFVEYGHWFQRHAVGDVDPRRVARVEGSGCEFGLTLEDGERIDVRRVVVGAGIGPFPHRPAPFDALPPEQVSHTSEHDGFEPFAGRRVLVVGAGQSGRESAALLREAGASVEILARSRDLRWLRDVSVDARPTLGERILPPTDVGGRATGWLAATPNAFRALPPRLQAAVSVRCLVPAGSGWLVRRLADVPITLGADVVDAAVHERGVRLLLAGGGEREADHVLLATGFEVDVERYEFLAPELVSSLDVANGYPLLRRGLESSVAGLHFVGAPAVRSFGPVLRFVVGSWYAAPAVCRSLLGRREPLLSFSF